MTLLPNRELTSDLNLGCQLTSWLRAYLHAVSLPSESTLTPFCGWAGRGSGLGGRSPAVVRGGTVRHTACFRGAGTGRTRVQLWERMQKAQTKPYTYFVVAVVQKHNSSHIHYSTMLNVFHLKYLHSYPPLPSSTASFSSFSSSSL